MSKKIEQARKLLIQLALDEICAEDNFKNFYRHTYYVIATLGLQLKAKEENLFTGKEWSNPHCKEHLLINLEKFLIRHIK